MADAWHQFGADLLVGPTGDLALVDAGLLSQQRVLRRLMTSPGEYLWQLDYGAGLGRFVGEPVDVSQVEAVIRGQMFKEPTVARRPEPIVEVSADATGTVYVHVRYGDAVSGTTQSVSFVTRNG